MAGGAREGLYFFPDLLLKRLDGIAGHPVSVVEAPSGFGKTTAVRECLRRVGGARQSWYTCFGEKPSRAWEQICRLFEGVNPQAAAELRECFPQSPEDMNRIAASMGNCRCSDNTFLVIDNYQLFDSIYSPSVPAAFSVLPGENLHVIFITQPLPFHESFRGDGNILRLGAKDFFFNRESTARLCRLKGARMSEHELDRVQSVTEGWVSAILLQASAYKDSGALADARDMESLIRTAVWNRLSAGERDFLLSLSLLDSFTLEEAAAAGGAPTLPEGLGAMLNGSFFIQYVSDKAAYSIHGILKDYLALRLENLPDDARRRMRYRVASACAGTGDFLRSAELYVDENDYDKALALPLTSAYINEQKERNILPLVDKIVDESPEAVLLKHPFRLLAFAFQFMQSGDGARFSRLMRLLKSLIDSPPAGVDRAELCRLRGETALLLSFTEFNDIERMSARHREAIACLQSSGSGGSSEAAVFGSTPWSFGIPSVLFLYWSKSGELNRELDQMDECLPVYQKLSAGHGAGAECVMRAETHLLRGEDRSAEACVYKALYLANEAGQSSVALCAELILARIKLLRGDGPGYGAARENIKKYRRGFPQRAVLRMVDLCLAGLDLALGNTDDLPEWLGSPEGVRNALYVQGRPYGLVMYAKILLLEKRFPELYGLTETMMEMGNGIRSVLPVLCRRILLASAKFAEGREEEAAERLEAALKIALPDRIFLPFAEFGANLLPLINKRMDGRNSAGLVALLERQKKGSAAIINHLKPYREALTEREKEIALLARDGLRTREIAGRLFVSENTVKSALKKIFSKLKIRSRNDLGKVDF